MNRREQWQEDESRKRTRERDARDEGTPIRSEARKEWIHKKVTAEEYRVFNLTPPSDFVPARAVGPKVYRPSTQTNEWDWHTDTDSDGPDMNKYHSSLVLEKRREEAGGSAERALHTSQAEASTSTGATTSHRPTQRPISSDSESDYESPATCHIVPRRRSSDSDSDAAAAPARRLPSVMPKSWRKRMQLPKKK